MMWLKYFNQPEHDKTNKISHVCQVKNPHYVDRPDMTSAVDRGCKASTQTKQNTIHVPTHIVSSPEPKAHR